MEDVRTLTLNNGMKALLLEDHSIPNAALFMFWKVGSRNEAPGITGLSHFFEHMMFNGAKKYGPKQFDWVMEASGGSNNAYTSEDVTVYLDLFPSSSAEVIFELEADRIADLALDDGMVESERGVILSERITRLENSNAELLDEQVRAVAFMAHPYRWPVVGYESDIRTWTKQDLQNYFDTYYAPNNGIAVLVGDVTQDEAQSLIRQYFEPIPAGNTPGPVRTVEPAQMGEKRLVVAKDVSSPNVMIAFHAPQARSEDYYATDLLNAILCQGKSSRLYNALVDEKQLAIEVSSGFAMAFDPTWLTVNAVCAHGVNEDALVKAIDDEMRRLAREPVGENELQKVKNRKLVDFYRAMETIFGKANTLGLYEVFFGDYRKMFSAPGDYQKVTALEIQRVASKILNPSNRTVGVLKRTEEAGP
jgi:predicted Zn-dependent peptidase